LRKWFSGYAPGARVAAIFPSLVLIPHKPQYVLHLPWVLQGLASRCDQACQEHLGGQVYPSKTKNKSQDNWVCFSPSKNIWRPETIMEPVSMAPRPWNSHFPKTKSLKDWDTELNP
jgi:hypothetical protein